MAHNQIKPENDYYLKTKLLAGCIILLLCWGCASERKYFGTKPPALALADAKADLLKADEQVPSAKSSIEMTQAHSAIDQALKLWDDNTGESTGSESEDDEIRELSYHATINAQTALALLHLKETEEGLNRIEMEKVKQDALKKQYQAEENQLRNILLKQEQLLAKQAAAEAAAETEKKAREEAQKQKELADMARQEAERAQSEAKRQQELAENARLVAIEEAQRSQKEKELAEARKSAALQAAQKSQAEKEMAEAGRLAAEEEARKSELAKQEALSRADAADRDKQDMEDKLKQLAAEFAQVREEKRGLVVTLSDILFDVNQAEIKPGSAKNLTHLAKILTQYADHRILVEGHTDSTGSEEHNQVLSEKRAMAVMAFLMDQGINGQMIESHGYGESQPVATNDTAEGRQRNRRVDIIILNKEGENKP